MCVISNTQTLETNRVNNQEISPKSATSGFNIQQAEEVKVSLEAC